MNKIGIFEVTIVINNEGEKEARVLFHLDPKNGMKKNVEHLGNIRRKNLTSLATGKYEVYDDYTFVKIEKK